MSVGGYFGVVQKVGFKENFFALNNLEYQMSFLPPGISYQRSQEANPIETRAHHQRNNNSAQRQRSSRDRGITILVCAKKLGRMNKARMVKLKQLWRKFSNYVRYDLKEIAFPSSLPDPPHIKPRRKLTLKEWIEVINKASRLYVESWKRDISDEIDILEGRTPQGKTQNGQKEGKEGYEREPSTLEDIAVAARGGMETLRPVLQRVYMTRASAYKDALKNFIEGYKEGIAETMDSKHSLKSPSNEDISNLAKEEKKEEQ